MDEKIINLSNYNLSNDHNYDLKHFNRNEIHHLLDYKNS